MSDTPDPLGDDHANHWTEHPATGERVDEASVIVDGQRLYWCGYSEPGEP